MPQLACSLPCSVVLAAHLFIFFQVNKLSHYLPKTPETQPWCPGVDTQTLFMYHSSEDKHIAPLHRRVSGMHMFRYLSLCTHRIISG